MLRRSLNTERTIRRGKTNNSYDKITFDDSRCGEFGSNLNTAISADDSETSRSLSPSPDTSDRSSSSDMPYLNNYGQRKRYSNSSEYEEPLSDSPGESIVVRSSQRRKRRHRDAGTSDRGFIPWSSRTRTASPVPASLLSGHCAEISPDRKGPREVRPYGGAWTQWNNNEHASSAVSVITWRNYVEP
ncbi:hypothetical protein Micbo1qcDRAFT_164100 [Microdochium bolleyi]|uniref:Uncharacterized protein n=1 Tax=Microdochium bolleyi TaxID=196109 RepID=A0A136IZX7_9PEZI|nr:hypothetical protein Micbo1qcDRAFT_164100 [Microdochium bolleyi]